MNERLLRALRREPVDRTPIWFMRQAGRSLPAYRALRRERGIADLIREPAAAAQITAMPLDYYELDAAVVFMDLSTPFEAAGLDVRFEPGVGPVVSPGLRTLDPAGLHEIDPDVSLAHVLEAIERTRALVDVPVIGFVGGPFTLCSYLLSGSRERRLAALRAMIWEDPEGWTRLATFWADQLVRFAIAQHSAGASAIQVFDSWAGVLSAEAYESIALPFSARLLSALSAAGVPTIHFATGNPAILPLLARGGGDAIGVDWRLPLDEAWARIGSDRAIQGNLDPARLLAGERTAVSAAIDVVERAAGRAGHIFNVGHGILPDTDPAVIGAVIEAIHQHSRR